jgi:hypothetical protein
MYFRRFESPYLQSEPSFLPGFSLSQKDSVSRVGASWQALRICARAPSSDPKLHFSSHHCEVLILLSCWRTKVWLVLAPSTGCGC